MNHRLIWKSGHLIFEKPQNRRIFGYNLDYFYQPLIISPTCFLDKRSKDSQAFSEKSPTDAFAIRVGGSGEGG
jgi:hypothetical protein